MTDTPPFDRAWMTPLLNKIADVAGVQAALRIGREKAGQQIYIPDTAKPDHWLAQLIGFEAAARMSEVWGSKSLDIPPALAGDKKRRAANLARLIAEGYSINKIVAITGLSRSTVKEHLKKRPKDDRQFTLF